MFFPSLDFLTYLLLYLLRASTADNIYVCGIWYRILESLLIDSHRNLDYVTLLTEKDAVAGNL